MSSSKKYPFKFLDAYSREDEDIFFGREEEVEALYQMVFQTDLILIFGASGTGKTSLIQCGLASKFQPYEWLALSIRRGDNLNASLEKALLESGGSTATELVEVDNLDWLSDDFDKLSDHGFDQISSTATKTESALGQKLKNLYLHHFKPIFLIFDQFEELYILGEKTEQDEFIESVREILRSEQPVKIILSIREEYLGYLYEFERKVPELLRKKLRIEPMNLGKVQSVVSGIGRLPQSNVQLEAGQEAAIGEGIFEKLKGREHTRTIELPYLQVFLDKLYLHITGDTERQADALFTHAALQEMGDIGDVLSNFLDEQVQHNARTLQTSPDTIKKLLAPFVTLDGTKDPLSASQLHNRLPELPSDFIARALQAFQNSRILRFDEKEQRYEVAHDSLARQIATYQDAEDVALQKAGQMIRTQLLIEDKDREVFSEKQLLFMEPYLGRLELKAVEKQWIERSRTHWQAERDAQVERERAELAKAQAQAERERGMREAAEENESRARQRTRLAVIVSAVALGLALLASWSFIRANAARKDAKDKASLAQKKQKEAEQNLAIANSLEKEVVHSLVIADSLRKVASANAALEQAQAKRANKSAEEAKAALQRQLAAERATKRQQLQTFLAQAGDFRSKKQYDAALDAYRNALPLVEDAKTKSKLQKDIQEFEQEKRENDFAINKERGLRLIEIKECKAARKYLEAALKIKPDVAIDAALKQCGY